MAVTLQDTNGQLWLITVNPDGSLNTTPTSGGSADPAGDTDYRTTLQQVVNLCSTHVDLMPLANVGGYVQEPALSLANDTLQELLAAPYNWKFNSKTAPMLVTQPGLQDLIFSGATAYVAGVGGASIALATDNAITQTGFVVTVRCLQPHNFKVGQTATLVNVALDAYNGAWVLTAVDAMTFTFTHTTSGLATSGASGVFDCSWLENAVMYDLSNPDNERELQAVRSMKRNSSYGVPDKINLVSQKGGVLTLRLSHRPQSTVWVLVLVYQMKPPVKTDLSESWSPFPDEYGFVYRQAFLARCYRFLDHRRADAEEQRSLAMIAKALDKDDVEDSDQYVSPERPLMGGLEW